MAPRDWFSDIQTVEEQAPAPAKGRDWFSEMNGGDEARPPDVGNAQLKYDPARSMGFGSQAKASFASDEEEWMRSAAKSLYPNEPLERSRPRIGKTAEGRYFHKGDDGQFYELQAPSGWGRLANTGSGVGPSLPAATGLIGGIVAAPAAATGVGVGASLAAAGTAAAGGEWLRQGIGDMILGEASTGDLNEASIAKEGALSTLGQGVGIGMGRFAERFAAPDLARIATPQAQRSVDELYNKADRIGVKLTPAEATGLQSQIAEQKRLRGIPQSFNVMGDFYKQRNADATRALDDFLTQVSPAQDAGRLGERAQKAATATVEAAKKKRTAVTSPLFKDAEREAGPIDVSSVVASLDAKIASAKGSSRTVLENVRKMLEDGQGGIDTTFAGLQSAKKEIGATLKKSAFAGDVEGTNRYSRSVLSDVYDDLNKAIDSAVQASPAGPKYAQGNKLYQDITKAEVDPVKEALGPLLRIAPENSSVVRAGKAMLDPSSRSPELIRQARTALAAKHPEVWNGLVRDFLQQETHAALQALAHGEQANVAGKVGKALGDTQTMANIREALGHTQFQAYKDMVDVFQAAGRALDANSDTAFKLSWDKIARRRDMGATAKVIEIARPWDKIKAAQEFFSERNYAKQAESIAKIITSGDRQALSQLRQLKQLKPGDWRRNVIIGDILVRGGFAALDKALE